MLSSTEPLPLRLTTFVGRRRELRELVRQIGSHRLITLTGVGGVGKTRLALEVADHARTRFPAGVAFVDVSPVTDPEALPSMLAAALGMRNRRAASPLEALTVGIGDRRLLLVIDNCERLAHPVGALVGPLLSACGGFAVLATSREPLGVLGETCHAVEPLPVADAVQLLCERTDNEDPGSGGIDRGMAAQLCNRLDGLPLAIELAAVRLRAMSMSDMVERLDSRFQLLNEARQDHTARHLSLRTTIDWSHDLLTQPEKVLFRRLSAFAAGFRLADAEAICAWTPVAVEQVALLLTRLVDRSMVVYREGHYELLQTLRDYARDRLLEAGEQTELGRRHAEHYLALVESAPTAEASLEENVSTLREAAEQEDNLRAAFDWLLDNRPTDYGRMVIAVAIAWAFRGNIWEQRLHCTRGLQIEETPTQVRVSLLLAVSALEFEAGNYPDSRSASETALRLARRVGDSALASEGLSWLGFLSILAGESAAASSLLEEAVASGQSAADGGRVAWARLFQGLLAMFTGDLPAARTLLSEAESGLRVSGRVFPLAQALIELGRVELMSGDQGSAREHLTEGLVLCRDLGGAFLSTLALDSLGALIAAEGKPERGLELVAASSAARGTLGITMPPAYDVLFDGLLEPSRRQLGPGRSAACSARGASLELPAAVELALAGRARTAITLSRREREVAELVTAGLTNREIAGRLHLSIRTVEGHVEHLLNRLGFERRSQIAAYVTRGELAKTT